MIQTEYATIPVSDGTSMRAFVARPESKPNAGLLVFQEAFGVNAHIRDVANRFAGEGYLAIAPELFHRTGSGFEGSYTDFAAVAPHFRGLTDAGLEADIHASVEWLERGEAAGLPVAATGYCMGGRAACLAGLVAPLACTISYYGGGIAPSQFFPGLLDRLHDLKSPILMFWGGKDQHIGPEQTQAITRALKSAGKPYVNVEFSEADHGFFCDERASYNPVAAAQAWPFTLAFLKSHIAAAARQAEA